MDKLTTVWTHGGPAHQDEFLACCLIVGAQPHCRILRQSQAPEGWDYAVDVGGVHDPARLMFDHHQLSNAGNGRCSLHLVAEHLGIRLFGEWADAVGVLDCGADEDRKPLRPAAWAGNPLIRYCLDRFGAGPVVDLDTLDMMGVIGSKLIAEQKAYDEAMAAINTEKGVADARHTRSFAATNEVCAAPSIHFLIVDGREDGTTNVVRKGELEIPEGVKELAVFTHPKGFVSVLKNTDIDSALECLYRKTRE